MPGISSRTLISMAEVLEIGTQLSGRYQITALLADVEVERLYHPKLISAIPHNPATSQKRPLSGHFFMGNSCYVFFTQRFPLLLHTRCTRRPTY